MSELRYDLGYLTDPTIYAVGRLPAVSDHEIYLNTAEAEANATSLRTSLNGVWKFHYAPRVEERSQGFYAPDFDCGQWDTIHVPGHIQLQGYDRPQYVNTQYPWDGHEALNAPEIPTQHNPVGSYLRDFELPLNWDGKRVTLTFHGVETAFFCWVNGQLIGYAEDSFTPSHFNITHALRPGMNRLAVEVYRFSTASWIEDQDFWRFSGIFRDVELTALPQAHVRDIFVHTDLDDGFTHAVLRTELSLDLPAEPVTLRAELIDPHGAVVDSYTADAKADMVLERPIQQPLLWSGESPALYTLRLTLLSPDGGEYEAAQTSVGFRRFELKNGLMTLNGKRIIFRGVNRHEFCMEHGRALTERHMREDILTLKRHNINAVRTCHYPNQSLWYKLCDEYGIYMIDEANLESHGSWQKLGKIVPDTALPDDDPAWLPALIDRAASMQERDKNHPSVLIWSCGNESYGGKDIFEMSQHLRQRDPSRLVHYEGVFNDRRFNHTSDIESRMYPPATEVAAFIEAHPEKPFILCEYAHAMGNSCGGLSKYIELEDRYPQYQGGFIWDMVDQALQVTAPNGKPRLAYGGDFGDQPTDRDFCGNGLLFADRRATPKLFETKYLYQDVRLKPDPSGVTVENRMMFTNASRYHLRWRLTRDGEAIQTGVLSTLDVPPGETRRYDLPIAAPSQPGEYVLHCGLYLSQATPWADESYELMHGSAVVAVIPKAQQPIQSNDTLSLGDVNIGIRDDSGNEIMFSHAEGGLCSLRGKDGRELICTVPSLSLYRAPTNNDLKNGNAVDAAIWQVASLYAAPKTLSHSKAAPFTIRYQYPLPLTDDAAVEVGYTVLRGGKLRVDMQSPGWKNLPNLPAFGLSLRLPGELCNVRYYGYGPWENYVDRKEGAYLGLFETTVRENLTPNLWPQECGNREGVRHLAVTDARGHGLRVEMVDSPLSVSVLPYSAQELSAARHIDELAEPTYTYLDVALCRMGVGGDDTWGAPVLPEYHIPSDKPLTLSFVLSIV